MKNAATTNENFQTANHFRNIFDQSLAILCEGESAVRRRSLPLHVDDVKLQKRALSDAADALAALWKISGSKTSRLRNGVVQYGR
jgi:hypothetical protein